MNTIDQRLRLPNLEQWLDEHHITWTLDPAIPLKQIDVTAGLVNQVRHEPLNQETVERYRDDIDAGDVFPALLLHDHNDRLIPLGGNHRLAAHIAVGATTTAGYRITCDDVTAQLAAYRDNRHHGRPTTLAENVSHALRLHRDGGLTVADASRAAGINRIHLDHRLGADRATSRAQDLGLVTRPRASDLEWRKLGIRCRYDLGRIHDTDVFHQAALLVLTRVISTGAVTKLVTRLNDLGPEAAIAALDELAAAEEGRVRNRAGRPHRANTHPAFALRHLLDQVMQFEPEPVVSDCPTPEQRQLTRGQIRAAARKLIAVDKALEAALVGSIKAVG
jgi:hypothetical protein